MMTTRECYRQIATFRKADHIPNYEPGLASTTPTAWRKEGLPAGVSVAEFFGLEDWGLVRDLNYGPLPGVPGRPANLDFYRPLVAALGYEATFDAKGAMVARKDGRDFYIGHDGWGSIKLYPNRELLKEGELADGAFVHVQDALTDRAEWESIKGHFRPDAARLPAKWPERVAALRASDQVRILEAPSMVGALALAMGFENYAMKLYDDRAMIEEILDARVELAMAVMGHALDDVEFDMMWFWEDMAFRSGPMVGPELFESLVVPRYRRLADWYRARGGEIVAVDSDGDVRLLIPGWIKGGINHIWPLEPFASMDVVALRKEYGQAFSMRGGIDKFVVAKGKEAIDRELDRVWPVVQDGGYIPHLDHQLPHAPFENYCYYMERKKQLLGVRP